MPITGKKKKSEKKSKMVTITISEEAAKLLEKITKGIEKPYELGNAQHSESDIVKAIKATVISQTPAQENTWTHRRDEVTVKFCPSGWRIMSTMDTARQDLFDAMFDYIKKSGESAVVPRLQIKKVPAADPRQMGPDAVMAIAKEELPANYLIGEYAGALMTQKEYKNQFPGIFGMNERQRYVFDLPQSDAPGNKKFLVVDGYGINGNETAAINDERGLGSNYSENARFVVVYINNWPHVFVYTTRRIRSGDEILLNYGKAYWDYHELVHNTLGSCHGMNGNKLELDCIKEFNSVLKNSLTMNENENI